MHSPHDPDARAIRSAVPDAPGFHELLFEWLERAPWLAISCAAHVALLLVLTLLPWERFDEQEPRLLRAATERVDEPVFEEPEPEEPEPLEPEELAEDPELVEPVLAEPTVDPTPLRSEDEMLLPSDLARDDPPPSPIRSANP